MPRVFHLVINPKALEFYADIVDYVTKLKYFQYLFVCEHFGQDTKHYHMLLQLSENLPKLSTKKLHGAHIKPKIYGSTQKIKDYIECKDEKHKAEGVTAVVIDEIGEMLKQGGNQLTIGEVVGMTDDEIKNNCGFILFFRPFILILHPKNNKCVRPDSSMDRTTLS